MKNYTFMLAFSMVYALFLQAGTNGPETKPSTTSFRMKIGEAKQLAADLEEKTRLIKERVTNFLKSLKPQEAAEITNAVKNFSPETQKLAIGALERLNPETQKKFLMFLPLLEEKTAAPLIDRILVVQRPDEIVDTIEDLANMRMQRLARDALRK